MEKIINSYETLFVIDPQLTEEATKAMVEKFSNLISENGTITEVNEWGKRRLAYPINDLNEGYYVLITFTSESKFPTELERVFGITEGIMRYIVIRHEEKKKSANANTAAPAPAEETTPEVEEDTQADEE